MEVAAQNRKRWLATNRSKVAVRDSQFLGAALQPRLDIGHLSYSFLGYVGTGRIPQPPWADPVVVFTKEYAAALKGWVMQSPKQIGWHSIHLFRTDYEVRPTKGYLMPLQRVLPRERTWASKKSCPHCILGA